MKKHMPYFLILLFVSIMFTIIGYTIDPERIFPESILITLFVFASLITLYFACRYLLSHFHRDVN